MGNARSQDEFDICGGDVGCKAPPLQEKGKMGNKEVGKGRSVGKARRGIRV